MARSSWSALAQSHGGTDPVAFAGAQSFTPLHAVKSGFTKHEMLGVAELDRVVNLVPGAVTVLGGAPGIGKSTLLLQLAAVLAGGRQHCADGLVNAGVAAREEAGFTAKPVAYVSGEESASQLQHRAQRMQLDVPDLHVLNETNMLHILGAAQEAQAAAPQGLGMLVVDSIQTTFMPHVQGSAGSVSQVRECALAAAAWAKQTGVPVLLVGHVTKSAELAGPLVLQHIVDAVLVLEQHAGLSGSDGGHRTLRAEKNRHGATSEVGVLEMTDLGLAEVRDPARLFLAASRLSDEAPAGVVVTPTLEGSRGLAVEVQALATKCMHEWPRHRATGVPIDRLFILLAVLSRHTNVPLGRQEVLINVAGGWRLHDRGADLALALAIASSVRDVPVPRALAAVGEVGLSGELRPVPGLARRINTAASLGFQHIVVPKLGWAGVKSAVRNVKAQVHPVATLQDALNVALPRGKRHSRAPAAGQDLDPEDSSE